MSNGECEGSASWGGILAARVQKVVGAKAGDGAALESNRAVKTGALMNRVDSGVWNDVKSEHLEAIHRRADTGGAASMPLSFKRRCCCAIVVGGRPRLA